MPGARERPQTTGVSPSPSLRTLRVCGEALWQLCLLDAGADKGPRVSIPHTGVSFQIGSRDVTESLYCLPLGQLVLPPSPRRDN